MSGFKCQECGKKFKTVKAAEKAQSSGCPQCGGCDIDLDDEFSYRATCLGHETTTGPIGSTAYCDGTCRRPMAQAAATTTEGR